eukprot:COSAG05_NODE_7890_length_758_cov_25.000000_1_plen_100_part_10
MRARGGGGRRGGGSCVRRPAWLMPRNAGRTMLLPLCLLVLPLQAAPAEGSPITWVSAGDAAGQALIVGMPLVPPMTTPMSSAHPPAAAAAAAGHPAAATA